MERVVVDQLEFEQKLCIAFTRAGGVLVKRLLNPRSSPAAERERDSAAHQLARFIADEMRTSGYQCTRPSQGDEAEANLRRLRENAAQRRLFGES